MRKIFASPLHINDIGFRLILVPAFGIAVPLLTHMIRVADFNHWELKAAFLYTIILALIIWEGNRYLLFTLRSYFNWFNQPVKKIVILLLVISFFTIPISSILLVGWYQVFKNGLVDWQIVNISTTVTMVCVLFITHTYETVFLVKESASEMLRNEQLQKAKVVAELQALKNQVDPHFMFNSLNTMGYLIEMHPVSAKAFNDNLADVYRYILQNNSKDLVPVQEEISFLKDYFNLQKIRYGEAVSLKLDIPPAVLEGYSLPPISLQVLAENVFKHNKFSLADPLLINLSWNGVQIVFSNKIHIKELGKYSSGIGLANLKERYRLHTGKEVQVTNDSTTFTIYLPVIKSQ